MCDVRGVMLPVPGINKNEPINVSLAMIWVN